MKTLNLPAFDLKSERLPYYLLAVRDKPLAAAAGRARAELALLFTMLETGDLLRGVVDIPDAIQSLTELAESAAAARASIVATRRAADDLLRTDAAERKRFDGAACELMGIAAQEAREKLAAAKAADAEGDRLRKSMAGAGLSASEIDAILQARKAEGDPRASDLRAEATAATAREAALGVFLADPLRDLGALPPDLAAALVERVQVIAAIRGPQALAAQAEAMRLEAADRLADLPKPVTPTWTESWLQRHSQPQAAGAALV